MKNRLFPRKALPLCKPLRLSSSAKSLVQLGNRDGSGSTFESCRHHPTNSTHFQKEGLSSSAKSLVQLGNTFTQSGCGCLKKCLQLSILLPLPSHKLHTYPKTHKKKSWGITLLEKLRAADEELKARNSAVQLCASYDSSCFVAAGLVVDLTT